MPELFQHVITTLNLMQQLLQPAVDSTRSLQTWQYSERLQATLIASVACSVYLSLVVRRLAPSYSSLWAIAPVLMVNALIPIAYPLEEVLSRLSWSLLLLWLANFKAIGLCLGRGPLIGSWNIPQTVLLYMFPIYPCQECSTKKGRLGDSHGNITQAVTSFVGNTILLCALGYILSHDLPKLVTHYLYGLGLYAFITFLMDGPAAVLIGALNMRVVPPFDKPWLSSSLADWWGRRWNNTTGLTLRALVYDPIVEGHLMARTVPAAVHGSSAGQQQQHTTGKSPMWLRFLGLCATFAVSGLMHEILLYLLVPTSQYQPGWWFSFFFVQAPLLLAESIVMGKLQSAQVVIPKVVAVPATTAVVMLTAWFFWYPPVEQHTDLALRIVGNVNANVGAMVAAGRGLMMQWQFSTWGRTVLELAQQMRPGIQAAVATSATAF